MPNIKTHCYYSKKRTGNPFKELHEWMDEPQKILKIDHRRVRHDASYIDEVIKKFGKDAVFEFLMHISADYKSTANKWKPRKFKKKEGFMI